MIAKTIALIIFFNILIAMFNAIYLCYQNDYLFTSGMLIGVSLGTVDLIRKQIGAIRDEWKRLKQLRSLRR